jgi:carbon starvation protein
VFFLGLPIAQPAFKGWVGPSGAATATLFPFLFVTIACGACSGFHGLVCSGTTSKQISRESDCKPVGYGAMLLEGLVAVIALATVMTVADGDLAGRNPGRIYGDGLGRFVAAVIGEEHLVFAATFGAMAFSTFIFDTIDVATRLGRYILQELFRWQSRAAMITATAATIAPVLLVLLVTRAVPGQPPPYMKFWTLFGTANQLLAALTLLGVVVWLDSERRRLWYVAVPMVLVLGITLWSLVVQVIAVDDLMLRGTALALLGLAVYLVIESVRAILRNRRGGAAPLAVAPAQ